MTRPRSYLDASVGAIEAIDKMVERVNRFKIDPQFTQQMEDRRRKAPNFAMSDSEVLRHLMILVAYSNNANSEKVTRLVEGPVFESIFQKYFVQKTSELTAESIVASCWQDLTAIRFKKKIDAWVRCARSLPSIQSRHGSFMRYLSSAGLPNPLKSEDDIGAFWEGFNQIRAYFQELHLPYFGNFTTLCHLLMHLGLDCAKPDIIVMRTAVDLGIVPAPPKRKNSEKSRAHAEESLKQAVRTIQGYAVGKNTRAPVIDLYFLIHGRQADAIGLVEPGYYRQRP
jgi:hypothetical protein